jgi:hypothetical protein
MKNQLYHHRFVSLNVRSVLLRNQHLFSYTSTDPVLQLMLPSEAKDTSSPLLLCFIGTIAEMTRELRSW